MLCRGDGEGSAKVSSIGLAAEPIQNLVAGHDIAELLNNILQRRAMLVVGQSRAAIRYHHDFEIDIMASRAVASQQMFVLVPATRSVFTSRLRNNRSRLEEPGISAL